MKVNVYHLYHLRVITRVVSLGSFHSHTLEQEKYVQHRMAHAQRKDQMVLDCLIQIISCLYQHILPVSFLCLVLLYSIKLHYQSDSAEGPATSKNPLQDRAMYKIWRR